MSDEQVWPLEEAFWLGGRETYTQTLAPECLMAFSIGLLGREDILRSIEGAPRWESVSMTERRVDRPDPGTVVLAYRATAERGAETYAAFCTSTYRRVGEAWKLIQHQQTPA